MEEAKGGVERTIWISEVWTVPFPSLWEVTLLLYNRYEHTHFSFSLHLSSRFDDPSRNPTLHLQTAIAGLGAPECIVSSAISLSLRLFSLCFWTLPFAMAGLNSITVQRFGIEFFRADLSRKHFAFILKFLFFSCFYRFSLRFFLLPFSFWFLWVFFCRVFLLCIACSC